MINPCSNTSLVRSNISFWFTFFNIIHEERYFLLLIIALFFITEVIYPNPEIAMWIGFILADFSPITNDFQVIFEEILK